MKLSRLLLSPAILVCLLASCTKPQKELIVITDFPQQETIPGVRVDLDSSLYLVPFIYPAGDYYLVYNRPDAPAFNVYDKEFNYVDSIISRGQGPDEMLAPTYYGQWSGPKDNPTIICFDSDAGKLYGSDINPFTGLKKIFDLPSGNNLRPSSIYYLKDTCYVGINLVIPAGTNIFTYNPVTDTVRNIPSLFKFDEMHSQAFYTSQCGLYIDQKNKEIIQYYFSVPWIVVYDFDLNPIRKIALFEQVDTETLSGDIESSIGIRDLQMVGDNYVGMLCEEKDSERRYKIVVMSREGDPKFMMDATGIRTFIPEPENDRMVTAKYDEEEDITYLEILPLSNFKK